MSSIMYGPRRLFLGAMPIEARTTFLVLLLAVNATPVRAEGYASFSGRLRLLCSHLQQHGWGSASDRGDSQHKQSSEIDVPGVMYLCNVEHHLAGKGPGRAPELQALLSDSDHQPSVIFSANVWCEEDRKAAFASLVEHVDRELAAIAVQMPPETLAASRNGLGSATSANGLRFLTAPVSVDPQACGNVREGAPGAVLMKVDVVIKPDSGSHRKIGGE